MFGKDLLILSTDLDFPQFSAWTCELNGSGAGTGLRRFLLGERVGCYVISHMHLCRLKDGGERSCSAGKICGRLAGILP